MTDWVDELPESAIENAASALEIFSQAIEPVVQIAELAQWAAAQVVHLLADAMRPIQALVANAALVIREVAKSLWRALRRPLIAVEPDSQTLRAFHDSSDQTRIAQAYAGQRYRPRARSLLVLLAAVPNGPNSSPSSRALIPLVGVAVVH